MIWLEQIPLKRTHEHEIDASYTEDAHTCSTIGSLGLGGAFRQSALDIDASADAREEVCAVVSQRGAPSGKKYPAPTGIGRGM